MIQCLRWQYQGLTSSLFSSGEIESILVESDWKVIFCEGLIIHMIFSYCLRVYGLFPFPIFLCSPFISHLLVVQMRPKSLISFPSFVNSSFSPSPNLYAALRACFRRRNACVCQQFPKWDLADVRVLFLGLGGCLQQLAREQRLWICLQQRGKVSTSISRDRRWGLQATCPQNLSWLRSSLHDNWLTSHLGRNWLRGDCAVTDLEVEN